MAAQDVEHTELFTADQACALGHLADAMGFAAVAESSGAGLCLRGFGSADVRARYGSVERDRLAAG